MMLLHRRTGQEQKCTADRLYLVDGDRGKSKYSKTEELTDGDMRIRSHRKLSYYTLWRNAGFLKMTKHLICGIFGRSIRRSDLYSVVFRLVFPDRDDVGRYLAVLKL